MPRQHFPGWTLRGYHHGFLADAHVNAAVVEQIRSVRPDVLLVGMGNPLQEHWIHRHRDWLPGTVCLGIGGLFDYWVGNVTPGAAVAAAARARVAVAALPATQGQGPPLPAGQPGLSRPRLPGKAGKTDPFHQRFQCTRSGRKRSAAGGCSAGKPKIARLWAMTCSGKAKSRRQMSIRSWRG